MLILCVMGSLLENGNYWIINSYLVCKTRTYQNSNLLKCTKNKNNNFFILHE